MAAFTTISTLKHPEWIVTGSNCEPPGYEPDALTIAPTIQIGIVGFEPTTSWSQIKRATELRHIP